MFFDKQKKLDRQLLKAAAKGDVEGIKKSLDGGAYIETRTSREDWSQTAIGTAALNGRIDAVRYLAARGADINATDRLGETPLISALVRKHIAIANLLIDLGADVAVIGTENRSALTEAEVARNRAMIDRIKSLLPQPEPQRELGQKMLDPVEEQQAAVVDAPQTLPSQHPDEVSFERPLGNRTLEEIFNFRARERISLLRTTPQGTVEAMTREGFDAIGDQAALHHAFAEYARRGGRLTEEEVFPQLQKPKTLPRVGG